MTRLLPKTLNNYYYPDELINENGYDDGGYNHYELRNHKRAYTLTRDDGSVVFSKNDKNPSMEQAEVWLSDLLGNL